jgi:serine/threonine-protein kinase
VTAEKSDAFGLCGATIDGKYRVLSVVGEGGFGLVYRGHHEGFGVPVAIKCLKIPAHVGPAAQEELVRKLRDEGRLLLQLSQRTSGIVQALDIGALTLRTGARVPYLVLEWLEGTSLSDDLAARLARGERGRTPAEALALLEPAARALDVAHQQRIAHRDVKPDNLFLVGPPGQQGMKVLDFGIAKVLADIPGDVAATAGLPSVFTPAYGAPEQFDKRRGPSGPWTDVFALALVFVEVVIGERALLGTDLWDFCAASIDPARRPTLRARGVEAGEAVEQVLLRALHVDVATRYPTAGAFWDALSAAVLASASAPVSGFDRTQAQPSGELPRAPSGGALPVAPTASATTAQPAVASARPEPPRGRAPFAVLLALAVAAAGGALAWRTSHPAGPIAASSSGEASPSASPSGAPGATVISKTPEAAALYGEALEAWRGGAPDDAVFAMERAAALDRDLGAAQLRLALWKFRKKPHDAREHYDLALRHRAALSPADASLLEATEPLLREPMDLDAYEKRLAALTAASPASLELWIYLGSARLKRLDYDGAIDALDHALALDEAAVAGWALKAQALSMKGDAKGQLGALERCLAHAPRARECLLNKVSLRGQLGECAGMRDDAKALLAMNPSSALTQRHLAIALFATGAPRDGVVEALGRSWSFRPDAQRKTEELTDRSALAVVEGNFTGATALLQQWQAEAASQPDQDAHAYPALALAEVYRETGQLKKAAEVAAEFQHRMGAWTEPSLDDWNIALLPHLARGGAIKPPELDKARSEWVERFRSKWTKAGRKVDTELEWMIWANARGAFVETPADAKDAIAALPKEVPALMATGRWPHVDVNVGKAQVLAGDPKSAIEPLRRAAGSCSALSDPGPWMAAHLYLGMALEGVGDVEGARAAYGEVIARWGKATPRSVTAEQAKRKLAALPKKP